MQNRCNGGGAETGKGTAGELLAQENTLTPWLIDQGVSVR